MNTPSPTAAAGARAPLSAAEIEAMSFEQALLALEEVVAALEQGESGALPLEEAIGAYERGILLSRQCERRLRQARMRVEKLNRDAKGEVTAEPFQSPDAKDP